MHIRNKIRTTLQVLLNHGRAIFHEITNHQKSYPYHIEEVDIQSHKIVLFCRGTRIIIKTTFESAVADNEVIQCLSPYEACLLGGYYGRALRAMLEGREMLKKAKEMSFLLKESNSQYKILFKNRDGKIGYVNEKTKQEFLEYPLTIVSHKYIISKFDSNQACYLGILAGLNIEKTIENSEKNERYSLKMRPILRIVK